MNNVKVILGIVFLVVGLWVLTIMPVYSFASDGTVVIHYLEIAAGAVLTVLGIFNIMRGRKE